MFFAARVYIRAEVKSGWVLGARCWVLAVLRLTASVRFTTNRIAPNTEHPSTTPIIASVKRVAVVLLFSLALACSDKTEPKPLSEPGEKLYPVRGVVLSRNASDNSLRVDHEAIPGFMEAMTMDYSVRGAKVETLPADKSRIEATLHVTQRSYWVTDVKRIP